MFCPRCGMESAEGQKFCKGCGTNMQVVSEAMTGSEDPLTLGQLKLDVEGLKRNAVEFAQTLKAGIHASSARGLRHSTEKMKAQLAREKLDPRLPKPKEWLGYSWQHNLKNGLISLFSGVGMGVLFYYIGRVLIEDGTNRSIQEQTGRNIQGIEHLVSLAWLLALAPVLKGLGQIFYAAFFAESIGTLAERFAPRVTAPVIAEPPRAVHLGASDSGSTEIPGLGQQPASVTEHTTQFFEETKPGEKFQTSEQR